MTVIFRIALNEVIYKQKSCLLMGFLKKLDLPELKRKKTEYKGFWQLNKMHCIFWPKRKTIDNLFIKLRASKINHSQPTCMWLLHRHDFIIIYNFQNVVCFSQWINHSDCYYLFAFSALRIFRHLTFLFPPSCLVFEKEN